jgi:hypothetical protein
VAAFPPSSGSPKDHCGCGTRHNFWLGLPSTHCGQQARCQGSTFERITVLTTQPRRKRADTQPPPKAKSNQVLKSSRVSRQERGWSPTRPTVPSADFFFLREQALQPSRYEQDLWDRSFILKELIRFFEGKRLPISTAALVESKLHPYKQAARMLSSGRALLQYKLGTEVK